MSDGHECVFHFSRLTTLLAQQKFEEAEAFAREFNLDPEVYVVSGLS